MPKKEEKNKVLDEFNEFIKQFKEEHDLNDYDLIDLILHKRDIAGDDIPVDIFTSKLGCLEAIVKYFKENKGFRFKKISELVNRSSADVINSYSKAKKKLSEIFSPKSNLFIPARIFNNKGLSVLESIVVYLKEERSLRFREIGKLIQRNEKTVWTVYKRGREKRI